MKPKSKPRSVRNLPHYQFRSRVGTTDSSHVATTLS